MERSYIRISLDLSGKAGACRPEIKQGDNHRSLYITLTDGGDPYTVTSDCSAVFVCKKPDEEVLYNFCTVENNTIIYDFTPQTTAVPGLLNCELRLYNAPRQLLSDEDGHLTIQGTDVGLLTSVTFQVRIVSNVCSDEQILESAGEHSALTQLYAQTQALVQAFNIALGTGQLDGPQGEKGDPGKDGEKGEKGDKGDPGENALDDKTIGSTGWSSQKIINTLCPTLQKQGGCLSLRPLVKSDILVIGTGSPTLQLQETGKNLLEPSIYYKNSKKDYVTLDGDVFTVNFNNGSLFINTNAYSHANTIFPAGTYTFSLFPVDCTAKLSVLIYQAQTGSQLTYWQISTAEPGRFTFTTDEAFYLSIGGHWENCTCSFRMQLEVGSTGTSYTRFSGSRFFELTEGVTHFINARPGITTLRTLDGTLSAEYYGDPAAMLLMALGMEEGTV